MTDRITFAQFDAVLAELGFEIREVPGSHVAYEHRSSGAVFMTRPHKPNDSVPEYVVVSARVQLDGQGIVKQNDFEAMLTGIAA